MAINKDEYINTLEKECFKYLGWVTELMREHDLWKEDGTYTFEDGESIRLFDPIGEMEDDD